MTDIINAIRKSQLASTTPGGEGASLIGTDSKTNLGGATTAEAAFTWLNTFVVSVLTSGSTGINAASIADGTVSNAEFQYLNSVTSNVQTQLDGKAAASHTHSPSDITGLVEYLQDNLAPAIIGGTNVTVTYNDGANTITIDAANGTISAGDLPSGINAANIADGTVSNAEFQYINSVTSNVQTQLDGKAASSHTHTASQITDFNEALEDRLGNTVLVAGTNVTITYNDGAGTITIAASGGGGGATNATDIADGSVSNTEFQYLNSVTSNVQTQLDGKAASSHTHAGSAITSGTVGLAYGGTGADLSAPTTGVFRMDSPGTVTIGAIVATDISSGTIATARLGSGSATGSTFLAGDQTYKAVTVTILAPLVDSNGNEVLTAVATTSAVNEFCVTNAATGNAPLLAPSGGDSNIDAKFGAKGTGGVHFVNGTFRDITADSDGSTITLDLSVSNLHSVTLGGNRTIALSNAKVGQIFSIRLLQDGTGSRTITWFTTIKWAGGSAPTLTTTASKADWIGFICTGSGTYDGFVMSANH